VLGGLRSVLIDIWLRFKVFIFFFENIQHFSRVCIVPCVDFTVSMGQLQDLCSSRFVSLQI